MPSYIGVGVSWKNGRAVMSAATFWNYDPLSENDLNDGLFQWAVKRWPASDGWANHTAHVVMELSADQLTRLLEHARDDVVKFGENE